MVPALFGYRDAGAPRICRPDRVIGRFQRMSQQLPCCGIVRVVSYRRAQVFRGLDGIVFLQQGVAQAVTQQRVVAARSQNFEQYGDLRTGHDRKVGGDALNSREMRFMIAQYIYGIQLRQE